MHYSHATVSASTHSPHLVKLLLSVMHGSEGLVEEEGANNGAEYVASQHISGVMRIVRYPCEPHPSRERCRHQRKNDRAGMCAAAEDTELVEDEEGEVDAACGVVRGVARRKGLESVPNLFF
eukprot:TRINITY_DN20461_c1_g1_i1.p3 TRINITY_DN20461_c1_g1~~TRINITY_DN20461_c1_g1_i1.p3  ORF type:complete len:122 (-),score=15.37 TRINITY_DN20461_c1_g1_i1:16-381(-)